MVALRIISWGLLCGWSTRPGRGQEYLGRDSKEPCHTRVFCVGSLGKHFFAGGRGSYRLNEVLNSPRSMGRMSEGVLGGCVRVALWGLSPWTRDVLESPWCGG